MKSILIVDDNVGLREQMKWALCSEYTVIEAGSSSECIDKFTQHRPSVVLLDMGLDNIPEKGLELLDLLLSMERTTKIIVITANTNDKLGPESVKKGAFDYFVKPADIERLSVIIERAFRLLSLESEVTNSSSEAQSLPINPEIAMIGTCGSMQKIFELIRRLSQTDVSVLIGGESGTGKELCARAIHYHSPRRNDPFVPINCGAIPESLIESELFGYVKGAFTGAASDKAGLFELADGGTLLLDEIGEMPKNLQVKLLRFLEDQKVQRLGDTQLRSVDVRIIAATNHKEINDSSSQRGLRSDLYYRLSEFQIDLPPLRERGQDILLISQNIIQKLRTKFNLQKLALSTRAEQSLLHYSWPGNVRELENKLSRAAITCTAQTIEPEDLSLSAASATNTSFKQARNMFEREYIINVLRQTSFNMSESARIAGISRPTLYDMIKKHAIELQKETILLD